MDSASRRERRWRWLSTAILVGSLAGLALLVVLPSFAPFVKRIEHQTADWRTALLSDRLDKQHPDVAVIIINEATLDDYPYLLPPDRSLLARLVRALDAYGAKVIGIDFYFARRTEPEKDEELIATLRSAKAKIVLGAFESRKLSDRQRELQRSFLERVGRPAGFLNLRKEPDGVVRYRANPSADKLMPESLAVVTAREAGGDPDAASERIAWLLPPRNGSEPFLTLPAEALFDGTPANAEAREKGQIAALAGKTVLIGGDIAYIDRHATPLSATSGKELPGVFVHAQVLAQILDRRTVAELTPGRVQIFLLVVALAAAALGWLLGTRHYNLVGWTAATAVLVIVDAMIFAEWRITLPYALMLMAWVLGAAAGRSARTLYAASGRAGP